MQDQGLASGGREESQELKHLQALADLRREHREEIAFLQAKWEAEFRDMELRIAESVTHTVMTTLNDDEDAERKLQTGYLDTRVEKLEKLAAALSCVDQKNSRRNRLIFKGCDLHIRNGTGKTKKTNGKGNLIVGYNERFGCNLGKSKCWRIGSHNIVVGPNHEYNSNGGIVAGDTNSLLGDGNAILGGE